MGKLYEIDGPDGAGKSSLALALASSIAEHGAVTLLRVNAFDVCDGSTVVGREFRRVCHALAPDSIEHNSYFLQAARHNYKYAQSLLEAGGSVVVDSSLVRAIAFAHDKCSTGAYKETVREFLSGRLTSGVVPDVRVFLSVSPQDLFLNLTKRDKVDDGDPSSHEEVLTRVESYRKALAIVRSRDSSDTKYMELSNPRSLNPANSINELVRQIMNGVK